MIRAGLALCVMAAAPAWGAVERVECRLSGPCPAHLLNCQTEVVAQWEVDLTQFAPPRDSAEPPRRAVTHVRMNGTRFAAEPLRIGAMRGFWEDAEALGQRMLVIDAEGRARYSEAPSGRKMRGSCRVERL